MKYRNVEIKLDIKSYTSEKLNIFQRKHRNIDVDDELMMLNVNYVVTEIIRLCMTLKYHIPICLNKPCLCF